VRPERLELPTFCSEDKRSVQLSYGRRLRRNYSLLKKKSCPPEYAQCAMLKRLSKSFRCEINLRQEDHLIAITLPECVLQRMPIESRVFLLIRSKIRKVSGPGSTAFAIIGFRDSLFFPSLIICLINIAF
jgi:hypothetical protein